VAGGRCIHNERVSLILASRIPHPHVRITLGSCSPVHVDSTHDMIELGEDIQRVGGLTDFERTWKSKDPCRTRRKATVQRVEVVSTFCSGIRNALPVGLVLVHRLGAQRGHTLAKAQERYPTGIVSKVTGAIAHRAPVPDSGEVRLCRSRPGSTLGQQTGGDGKCRYPHHNRTNETSSHLETPSSQAYGTHGPRIHGRISQTSAAPSVSRLIRPHGEHGGVAAGEL